MSAIRAARVPQAELEVASPEKPGIDLKLLVPTLALVSLGVAMVFSASIPMTAAGEQEDVFYYLKREGLVAAIALLAMFGVTRIPMGWIRRRAGVLLGATIALLVLVLKFGTEVNGARSWFMVPGIGLHFQPSEMAKVALVIAAARYFAQFPQGIPNWRRAIPPVAMLGATAGLVALQPDMGTAALIAFSMFVYFHIGGLKLRHILATGFAASIPAALMALTHPYQVARLVDFVKGSEVELAGGYQTARSLIALGSGGLTGSGYCGSIEKYFYLPEATTDSILAVVGEELGLLATWAVVGLFAYLVWRGLFIAARSPDRFAALVAAGVSCSLGVQALVNIAVVTGSVPATGVPLPFVSYGGSSLLFSLIGVGLLINVSREMAAAAAQQRP